MRLALVAGTLALLAAGTAAAQTLGDRPSEQDMFGGASTPAPAGAPAPPAVPAAPLPSPATTPAPPAASAAAAGTERDQELLGSGEEAKFLSGYVAPENPLQIGGQLYLRAQSTASGGQPPDKWSFSDPSLLDLYLDARPNPRVRGFILGRMSYDPSLAPNVSTPMAGFMSTGALAGGNPTGFSTFSNTRGPATLLDQMWIRFDIEQKVFITAGKQHVRWGTGHFWQPTDYLHQQKRNPLDVFDARPGTTMLKLNVPWEEKGWNFYGFAIAEDPNSPTPTLRQVAGALRAEVVLAGIELGADTYLRRDQKPRFGFDASTGIWDFDVYADVAIRPGDDFVHDFPGIGISTFSGYETQAVGGLTYSRKYNDNDMWTAGIEYFYNHPGYTDAAAYPDLLQDAFVAGNTDAFPFFYLGRHYGAAYVSFPAPYSWNYTTFTLSTLGNLSDQSFVTRLDYSVTFLTHLTFQAFAGVHYGHIGGEFRFRLPPDFVAAYPAILTALPNPASLTDYPVADLGVALLIKI
ncbi:MAG TPA: hypothetical protein VMT03_16715 [Polyangia bacterium]|nr:hypothetical protein [Polyangia bacterium]